MGTIVKGTHETPEGEVRAEIVFDDVTLLLLTAQIVNLTTRSARVIVTKDNETVLLDQLFGPGLTPIPIPTTGAARTVLVREKADRYSGASVRIAWPAG